MNKGILGGYIIIALVLIVAVQPFVEARLTEKTGVFLDYNSLTKTATISNLLGEVAKTQIIENTPNCFDCYSITKVIFAKAINYYPSDWKTTFDVAKGTLSNYRESIYYYKTETYTYTVDDWGKCSKEVSLYDKEVGKNTTQKIEYSCVVGKKEMQRTGQVQVYPDLSKEGFKTGIEYYILRQGSLTLNSAIDYIPVAYGVKVSEEAWWNTDFGFKRKMYVNGSNTVSILNFTYYVNGSKYNFGQDSYALTKIGSLPPSSTANASQYLYYGNGSVAITNGSENEQMPMDCLGGDNCTNYSRTSVYEPEYLLFLPIAESAGTITQDRTVNAKNGAVYAGTSAVIAYIVGGGYVQNGINMTPVGNDVNGIANISGDLSVGETTGLTGCLWLKWQGTWYSGAAGTPAGNATAGGVLAYGGAGSGYDQWSMRIETTDAMNVYIKPSGSYEFASFHPIPDKGWHFWCFTYASPVIKLYMDGVLKDTENCGTCAGGTTKVDKFSVGSDVGGTNTYMTEGMYDEIILINDTMSAEWVKATYDMYAFNGNNRLLTEETSATTPIVNITSPSVNDTNYTAFPSFQFEIIDTTTTCGVTYTPAFQINIWNETNGSLIYHTSNQADFSSSTCNVGANYTAIYSIHSTIPDGTYKYSINATNTGGITGWNFNGNRTFTVDNTRPVVTITAPAGEYYSDTLPFSVPLAFTYVESRPRTCMYYLNTSNITLPTCTASTISVSGTGDYNVTLYINDSSGNIGNKTSNFTVYSFNAISSTDFGDAKINTTPGDVVTFRLQVNASDMYWINATFNLNGTLYNWDARDNTSTQANFTKTITIPTVTTQTMYYYNWNYTLNTMSNNSDKNTLYYIQNVNNMTVTPLGTSVGSACEAGLSVSYNFSLKDELNWTNISHDVNYNIMYGLTNNTQYHIYGNISSVDSFVFCINASVFNNYSIGSGELQYYRTDYATRNYYLFTGQRATTTIANINLYNIENIYTTTFEFNAKDYLLNPYSGYYVALMRWYPENDSYKIVEMGKLNGEGKTVMEVVLNTVDYRVALYSQGGTLIKLSSPTKMICSSTPCSYNIFVLGEATDYTTILGIQSSITMDAVTHILTFTWNDASQATNSVRFDVYKDSGYTKTSICNSTMADYVGVLTCDISDYNGTIIAKGYRTASPEEPFVVMMWSIGAYLNRQMALFIQFILTSLAATLALWNPIAAVMFTLLSLVFGVATRLISIWVFSGAVVVAIVVIHWMQRSQAR